MKNPNWLEANQLAFYKCGQGFHLGTTMNESNSSSVQCGSDLASGPLDCRKKNFLVENVKYCVF